MPIMSEAVAYDETVSAIYPEDKNVYLSDEEMEARLKAAEWFGQQDPFLDFIDTSNAEVDQGPLPPVYPTEFTSFAFRILKKDGLGYENFSFEGRRHMEPIYNTFSRRILLCFGRQTEKCCDVDSLISMSDGSFKRAGNIQPGDVIATMDAVTGAKVTTGKVTWVSKPKVKPCVKFKTRQGHTTIVAKTHPMRQWNRWTPAGDIKKGDRLATVRRAGEFYDETVAIERIVLTALLLGDGYNHSKQIRFQASDGPKLAEFLRSLSASGHTFHVAESLPKPLKGMVRKQKTGRKILRQVTVHQGGSVQRWLAEDGLLDKKSAHKYVPSWVFRLGREHTALFINRLWCTDGSIDSHKPTNYDLTYSTISYQLARQVQALLWKFGIPSRIRENWPNIYKRRGEKKFAYILRIETQKGINTFLSQIGALGKSENIPLCVVEENNNRDTFPHEVVKDFQKVHASVHMQTKSLYASGLRLKLRYPPTQAKFEALLQYYQNQNSVDLLKVEALAQHLNTDLYWDAVQEVEDVGSRTCVDFTVEEHSNFVCDGFITHNSTYLGNNLINWSCTIPGHRSLYVSPSATQTKTFSSDRIKEPLETSPVLRSYTTSMLSQNVFEKQFVNRSKIVLRYAFLNADRCLAGDTPITLEGGSSVLLKDIAARPDLYVGQNVPCLTTDGLGVTYAPITKVMKRGVRRVHHISFSNGENLRATVDQRFYTLNGWKELQYIKEGEAVACATQDEYGVYQVSWLRVRLAFEADDQETFDLEISGTENYLTKTVFVHNCRGIPTWVTVLDELQDLLADNIPVIEQSSAHAPENFKRFIYAGTPKTYDNTIEYYRSGVSKDGRPMSTQGEWVVPCDSCGSSVGSGRYWNILGEKNIGKKSLICANCGKQIYPMHPDAQWAHACVDGVFEAYRVPQLMVPWRSWEEILLDYSRYSRSRFFNEVLGLSADDGVKPLTMADLMGCCVPSVTMHPEELERIRKSGVDVFAGIDWGGDAHSYTVLTLGAYISGKFRIFWIHRFVGEDEDSVVQLQKIKEICKAFSVKIIGADWGGGHHQNTELIRKFGRQRVQKFQYAARLKRKVSFENHIQRFMVHRTLVMSDMFGAIKRGAIELPRWEEFREPYATDCLNIHSTWNRTLRMVQYEHRPDKPDDSFHSILYCFLASHIIYPRTDIIAPDKEQPNEVTEYTAQYS